MYQNSKRNKFLVKLISFPDKARIVIRVLEIKRKKELRGKTVRDVIAFNAVGTFAHEGRGFRRKRRILHARRRECRRYTDYDCAKRSPKSLGGGEGGSSHCRIRSNKCPTSSSCHLGRAVACHPPLFLSPSLTPQPVHPLFLIFSSSSLRAPSVSFPLIIPYLYLGPFGSQ